MKRSEIFEAYAQIAMENGLVLTDKTSDKEKNKNRRGTDDVSSIEIMYGKKPDSDAKHIMEQAHPDSVVVAPSYDKLQGLVENNIERQNIMLSIVEKPVTGFANQKKYAQAELIKELVRIANHLDNTGRDELRALADDCIEDLSGAKIKKEALAPLAIAGIAVACAAVLGGIYLVSHLDDPNKGISVNCDNAIEKINSLLEDDGNGTFGTFFHGKLRNDAMANIKKLKADIETLKAGVDTYTSIKNELYDPKTRDQLKSLGKNKGAIAEAALSKFKDHINNILPEIKSAISNYKEDSFKHEQYQEESTLSEWSGRLGDILHGGNGFTIDKFDAVTKALTPLETSMMETVEFIEKKLPKYEEGVAQRLSDSPDFKEHKDSAPAIKPPAIPDMAETNHQEDRELVPQH